MNVSWKIVEKIGEGISSTVYKVVSSASGREFAAKVAKDNFNRNLEMESKKHSMLKHPNILQYVTSFYGKIVDNSIIEDPDKKKYVIILELCHQTFTDFFSEKIPSLDKIKTYFLGIIEALLYMKEKGLVHADVKTDNLIICGGTSRLSDFGASGKYGVRKNLVGTPYYMPPEAWINKEYDDKSDVWSLGVTLYKIYYGKFPFSKISTDALKDAIINEPLKFPNERYTGFLKTKKENEEAFKLLINQMLNKNPDDRINMLEVYKSDFFSTPVVQESININDFDNKKDLLKKYKQEFGSGDIDEFYIFVAEMNPDVPPMSRKEFMEIYNQIV